MPIYEYVCPTCGLQTALLVQAFDDPPTCEGGLGAAHASTVMEKVPSTPSFIVRGFNAANGYSRTTAGN